MSASYRYSLDDVRAAIAEFRALGLNSLVINRFLGNNIRSLNDLSQFTEAELRAMPGIGETTIKQVRLYLRPDGEEQERDTNSFVATMILAPSLVEAVDSWVKQNFERASRADAIRTLIRLGLQAQTPVNEN